MLDLKIPGGFHFPIQTLIDILPTTLPLFLARLLSLHFLCISPHFPFAYKLLQGKHKKFVFAFLLNPQPLEQSPLLTMLSVYIC